MRETIDHLRLRAEWKGLNLVLERRPHLPPAIHSDATKIRQVIMIRRIADRQSSLGEALTQAAAPFDYSTSLLAFKADDAGVNSAAP